jgi:hypothetical protein
VAGSGQKIKMPIIHCTQCNKFQNVLPSENDVLLEYINPMFATTTTTTQETNEFTTEQLPRPLVKMAELHGN